jgi:hypothetical protein
MQTQTTGNADKKSIFTRYADAVGAERFRFVITEFKESGTQAFLHDKKNGGYDGKTKEEIIEALPKFSAYSRYNKNVIVTPLSGDKHHILVDDLTPEKLKQLRDDGYKPACIIESSPENYQAIITIPSLEGDSSKDRYSANRLTKDLNLKYGDPKLSGSVHGHRLPPFPNQKPKHRREDGTYPDTILVEARGGICEKALRELEAIRASQREAEERARRDEKRMAGRTDLSLPSSADADSAYWTHFRDIMRNRSEGAPTDYSRIDGMIAIRMRVTGHAKDRIRDAIEANAPGMRRESMSGEEYAGKYGNRNWRRYAKETADSFAFGPRGLSQYENARKYRPRLLKLEGRDAREETRREYARKAEQERQDERISGR